MSQARLNRSGASVLPYLEQLESAARFFLAELSSDAVSSYVAQDRAAAWYMLVYSELHRSLKDPFPLTRRLNLAIARAAQAETDELGRVRFQMEQQLEVLEAFMAIARSEPEPS